MHINENDINLVVLFESLNLDNKFFISNTILYNEKANQILTCSKQRIRLRKIIDVSEKVHAALDKIIL